MEVKVFKPQNDTLKKYIEYYYLLRHSSTTPTTYTTYPSLYTIVAAAAAAEFEISYNKIVTRPAGASECASSLVAHFSHPLIFTYEGEITELTIYFKPNGINAFLQKPLSHYNKGTFNLFNPWPDYHMTMNGILKIGNEEKMILALEQYMLSKWHGKVNAMFERMLADILRTASEDVFSVTELCQRHRVTRKTVHKLFVDLTGKSPSQFKKTVRFRQALSKAINPVNSILLTEVAHGTNYYDQAHMLKDFRALTNQNPRSLVKSLSTIYDKVIFWQIK